MRFGALILASLVAVDPFGWDRFGPLRWALVSTIGLTIVAASLFGDDRHARWMPRWAVVGWSLLLSGLTVSTVLSDDPWHALVGTPDRHLGLAAWLLGVGLFWAAGARARSAAGAVAAAAVAGTALVGVYAFAELLGVEALDIDFAGDRVGATFGQPAYLGAAMALTLPITLGATGLTVGGRRLGPLAWSSFALGLVALAASQSRAAWVGVVVVTVVAVAAGRLEHRAHRSITIAAAVAIAVVFTITPLGGRLWALTDVTEGVVGGRVDEWQVGVRALAGSDTGGLIGYGPEGYRIVFGEHVDEQYVIDHGRDVFTDRAHNGVLDVALTGGWVAAIGFTVLLVGLARTAVRAIGESDRLRAGLAAGALAFATQQLFLFPLAELDPTFWVVAGLVVAGARDRIPRTGTVAVDRAKRLAGTAAGTLALLAAIGGGLDIAADHRIDTALKRSDRTIADTATELRPDSIRYAFIASRLAPDPESALEHLLAGLVISPLDPALRIEEASVLLDRARLTDDPVHLGDALTALEDLDRTDPNHPESQLRLGVARALAGDVDGGVTAMTRAADLAPGSNAPLVNLAVLLIDAGRLEEAGTALARAAERDPTDPRVASLEAEITHIRSSRRATESETFGE